MYIVAGGSWDGDAARTSEILVSHYSPWSVLETSPSTEFMTLNRFKMVHLDGNTYLAGKLKLHM